MKESQYDHLLQTAADGFVRLGLMTNEVWSVDPVRLLFMLSRYKFAAKMLAGKDAVAEIGCGDGFCSKIVVNAVGKLDLYDFDPVFVEDIRQRDPSMSAAVHDIVDEPLPAKYDVIYAIDVFEHIADSQTLLKNVHASLNPHGVLLLGAPSLESQPYASVPSRVGHVNCLSGEHFRHTIEPFFHNVFLFSMNDEVVHTGFAPMAHYLFVLAVEPKVLT